MERGDRRNAGRIKGWGRIITDWEKLKERMKDAEGRDWGIKE